MFPYVLHTVAHLWVRYQYLPDQIAGLVTRHLRDVELPVQNLLIQVRCVWILEW